MGQKCFFFVLYFVLKAYLAALCAMCLFTSLRSRPPGGSALPAGLSFTAAA